MNKLLDCSAATESLIECARRHGELDSALERHLNMCPACRQRWDAERSLTKGLRLMRIHATSRGWPHASREASREAQREAQRNALLSEFAARKRQPAARRGWLWTAAAAAVLLLSTLVVRNLVTRPEGNLNRAAVEETGDPQQEDFIEVPFAPPLAQGELIRVVHTELQPGALATLGVNVDPAWTTELPADLLLGQDGFPRAVRVSNEYSGEGGF